MRGENGPEIGVFIVMTGVGKDVMSHRFFSRKFTSVHIYVIRYNTSSNCLDLKRLYRKFDTAIGCVEFGDSSSFDCEHIPVPMNRYYPI
jgi:hypothetical protein